MKVEKYNDIICLDLAPEQEKSHRGSASSCPDRKTMSLNWTEKNLIILLLKPFLDRNWFFKKYLFWVRVEPFGQTELSLPAEEEDKLDRHCKVENEIASSPNLPWLVVIGIVSARSLLNRCCCWQSTRRLHFAPLLPLFALFALLARVVIVGCRLPCSLIRDKPEPKHTTNTNLMHFFKHMTTKHAYLARWYETNLKRRDTQKWSTPKLYFEGKEENNEKGWMIASDQTIILGL